MIIAARHAGRRVYRADRDHALIDGVRVAFSQLPQRLQLETPSSATTPVSSTEK
jgi:hypothetical protein